MYKGLEMMKFKERYKQEEGHLSNGCFTVKGVLFLLSLIVGDIRVCLSTWDRGREWDRPKRVRGPSSKKDEESSSKQRATQNQWGVISVPAQV